MYWLVFASFGLLIIRAIFEISKDVGVAENAGEPKRFGSSVESRLIDRNINVPGGMRSIIDGVCNFNERVRNFTERLPIFHKINIDRSGSYDDNPKTTSYLRAKKDL